MPDCVTLSIRRVPASGAALITFGAVAGPKGSVTFALLIC